MIKLVNTNTSAAANIAVPLNVKFNTNRKIKFDSTTNEIIVNNPGLFEINVNLSITSTTATSVKAALYANDIIIPETLTQITFAAIGDVATLTVLDTERILPTFDNEKVAFTIKIDTAATINAVDVTVKEIR